MKKPTRITQMNADQNCMIVRDPAPVGVIANSAAVARDRVMPRRDYRE